MSKTWVLVAEIIDDGNPEYLQQREIIAAAFLDLTAGLEAVVISCIEKSLINACGVEWHARSKYCKCVRPKGHKAPHSTVLYPEDVK